MYISIELDQVSFIYEIEQGYSHAQVHQVEQERTRKGNVAPDSKPVAVVVKRVVPRKENA
jgi:hypothetical protein